MLYEYTSQFHLTNDFPTISINIAHKKIPNNPELLKATTFNTRIMQ